MKLIKTFSLAIVIAIGTMAFIGASSASATLCKVNENPCSAANQYPEHTTVLMATTEKGTFKGNFVMECDTHATWLYEGTGAEGKLLGKITLLDWSGCNACTSITTLEPLPTFDDEAIGGGNGKAIVLNTAIKLSGCPLGSTCKFSMKEAALTFTGGTINGTAHLTAKEDPVLVEGFGCGSLTTWSALFGITAVNGSTTGSIFLE
jgi:hypothetical protein